MSIFRFCSSQQKESTGRAYIYPSERYDNRGCLLADLPVLQESFPVPCRSFRSFHSRNCQANLSRGQFTQKATAIKSIIGILNDRFGRPTLSPLHKMSDAQCEEFLTSLPRVGGKVARCVMLYSLGRKVFPVDTHCRRVAQRLGWIDSEDFDEDLLQSMIPAELRFSLHVNFISLGREFCTSKAPSCGTCPLKQLCPKIGLGKAPDKRPGLAIQHYGASSARGAQCSSKRGSVGAD